ncbi:dystroglycan-like [Acipenser oxyrinchus oxyrinchus]|uniref:Dystroglycan 1 n=1 Tax=Acipenser oxyrinchus oxyrinchus TaxID=40147 RepID=A0AAD8DGK1_ACIOX|nr:dystroglycan-like [Acipenser oxyrinchus oxyrinchus]
MAPVHFPVLLLTLMGPVSFNCFMSSSQATTDQHACNNIKEFRGIPDKVFNAGKMFYFPIPPLAFSGPVKEYKIQRSTAIPTVSVLLLQTSVPVSLTGDTAYLPKWLDYNQKTNTLQGLPVSEDAGEYTLSVAAVGSCLQDTHLPKIHFYLHILNDTQNFKGLKSSKQNVINNHGCPEDESVTYADIVLQTNAFSLNAHQRLSLVSAMADYLHVDPFSITLHSLRDASQLQLENSTLLAEDTGNKSLIPGHGMEIYWPNVLESVGRTAVLLKNATGVPLTPLLSQQEAETDGFMTDLSSHLSLLMDDQEMTASTHFDTSMFPFTSFSFATTPTSAASITASQPPEHSCLQVSYIIALFPQSVKIFSTINMAVISTEPLLDDISGRMTYSTAFGSIIPAIPSSQFKSSVTKSSSLSSEEVSKVLIFKTATETDLYYIASTTVLSPHKVSSSVLLSTQYLSLLLPVVSFSELLFSEPTVSLTALTKIVPPTGKSETPAFKPDAIQTVSFIDFVLSVSQTLTIPSVKEDLFQSSHSTFEPPPQLSPLFSLDVFPTTILFSHRPLLSKSQDEPQLSYTQMPLNTLSQQMQDSLYSTVEETYQLTMLGPITPTRSFEGELGHTSFSTPSVPQKHSLEPSYPVSNISVLPFKDSLIPSILATLPMESSLNMLMLSEYLTSFIPFVSPGASSLISPDKKTTRLDDENSLIQQSSPKTPTISMGPAPTLTYKVDIHSSTPLPAEHSIAIPIDTLFTSYHFTPEVSSTAETHSFSTSTVPFLHPSPSVREQFSSSVLYFTAPHIQQPTSTHSFTSPALLYNTPGDTLPFTPYTTVSLPETKYAVVSPTSTIFFATTSIKMTATLYFPYLTLSRSLQQLLEPSKPASYMFTSSFSFLTLWTTKMNTTSHVYPVSSTTAHLGKDSRSFSTSLEFWSTAGRPSLQASKTAIENTSPTVIHPIDVLFATIGFPFQYTIPSNTFSDREDGNTTNLILAMAAADSSPSGPESWVRLDQTQQIIQGYPLETDLQYSPQTFILTAMDSGGYSIQQTFTIELRFANTDPCHLYTVRTKNSYNSFIKDRRRIEQFVDKMAEYFNGTSSKHISVSTLRPGSTVVSWYNTTLCFATNKAQHQCQKNKILAVLVEMKMPDGKVNPGFVEAMLPEFRITTVDNVTYGGVCILDSDLAPTATTTDSFFKSDKNYWIVTTLIVLLIILCLFLVVVLAVTIYRSCRKYEKILPSESLLFQNDRAAGHLELDTLRPRKPPLFHQDGPPPSPPPQLWVTRCQPQRIPLSHNNIIPNMLYQRDNLPTHSPPKYQLPPPYELSSSIVKAQTQRPYNKI